MSRSNRKIKTLFAIWTWLRKEATMDAVINDDGPIPTTRWVPLLDEKGGPVMRMSEWSGYEYPKKVSQPIPEKELKADLNRYIYQLQYIPASERDEWGMSLVKKAHKESKSAGKREIAQQLQEMRDDFWQRAEEEGWEEFSRLQQHWPVDRNSWVAMARERTQRVEREIVKSWEDKAFYDKNPSSRDFWERCDPRAGCSYCGGEECDGDYWPGINLVYRDFLLHGTTLDWDYDPEYDDEYEAYYSQRCWERNMPSDEEMWHLHGLEEAEITRCNRYIDKMDFDIEMMHHENELLEAEWEDDDWNDFFPGYKKPLEETEQLRSAHAERRRRTFAK